MNNNSSNPNRIPYPLYPLKRSYEHNLYMLLPASVSLQLLPEWLYNFGHDFVEFPSFIVPNSSTFHPLFTFKGLTFTTTVALLLIPIF